MLLRRGAALLTVLPRHLFPKNTKKPPFTTAKESIKINIL